MKKRIVIVGANGFLGRSLAKYFDGRTYDLIGVVRVPGSAPVGVREVLWDGMTLSGWTGALEGAEAVINLAGRSVNCRYHARHRAEILESRTGTTRLLGEAIALLNNPPQVWINSSTATIYRHAEDGPQDELEGELGTGFSVGIANAWEKTFFQARVPGTVRKVALRTALVLAQERGTVFDYFWNIVRAGLGGRMGNGRQRVSWVHIEDFCRAVEWTMTHDEFEGVANVVAPDVPTNAEFMAQMRAAAKVPFGLPATRRMIQLGCWAMRSEAELVLKSRWVRARRLARAGFEFRWKTLPGCLRHLAYGRARPEGLPELRKKLSES